MQCSGFFLHCNKRSWGVGNIMIKPWTVMIVSLLILILPYSQTSHSSHQTLFVIFMLLTIIIIHESSTILHQPHFQIMMYYSRVFDSLSIVGHLMTSMIV